MKKIFITGGHLTPAVSVIEEIKRQKKPWDITFIGRRFAFDNDSTESEEYKTVTNLGIKFLPLHTGRLMRSLSIATVASLLKIPFGFYQASAYIRKFKPDAIISFGGYIAVPVVVSGWLHGVPSLTHEQTLAPGLANRIMSRFVKTICLSFPDAKSAFPKEKTVETGLPLRRGIFHPPDHASFILPKSRPIIYIAGGSTGAKSLNELVYSILPDLVDALTIVHQVGRTSLDEGLRQRELLPVKVRQYYQPQAYLEVSDLSWLLHHAMIYVGRSGANTIGELSATGMSGIFIPLPWSGAGEQEANALYMVNNGHGILLRQGDLTPAKLQAEIMAMVKNDRVYTRHPDENSFSQASPNIVSQIEKILAP